MMCGGCDVRVKVMACMGTWRCRTSLLVCSGVRDNSSFAILVYTQSVCHILEVVCGPVAALLKEQIRRNKARKERLLKEKEKLQEELGELVGIEV